MLLVVCLFDFSCCGIIKRAQAVTTGNECDERLQTDSHCLLVLQNVFVVSTGKRLEAYYDVPSSNGDRIMVHPEAFTLQAGLQGHQAEPPRPQEVFRALCMTHDGHIAWVMASLSYLKYNWLGPFYTTITEPYGLEQNALGCLCRPQEKVELVKA